MSRSRSFLPCRADSEIAAKASLASHGVGVDQSLPGGSLDHHHADRMADDVVQLTGDASSLVPQGDLGEALSFVLELLGSQRKVVGGLLA